MVGHLQDDDVFMRDQVQRQASFALFADEVALEEAAARDQLVLCDAGKQGDAPLDREQARRGAAGDDLRWEVDQLGVLAPWSDRDRDVAALGAGLGRTR